MGLWIRAAVDLGFFLLGFQNSSKFCQPSFYDNQKDYASYLKII